MTNNVLYSQARKIYSAYINRKELQRILLVKTIASVLLTFLWYFAWIYSTVIYFMRPWATFNYKNILVYITAFAVLSAPFVLFKPQRYLFTKPFIGQITAISNENLVVDRSSQINYIKIKLIATDSSYAKTVRVKHTRDIDNYYKNGDCVLLLRGLQYPIKITTCDQCNAYVFCPFCGRFSPKNYTHCFECSKPIFFKN